MSNGELVCSGDKKLVEEILKNGFCEVVKCDKADTCEGVCKD